MKIARNMPIVVYDSVGLFSAPRVAWMLRYFGADDVRILNGGLKKWQAEGRPLCTGPFTDFVEYFGAEYDYTV